MSIFRNFSNKFFKDFTSNPSKYFKPDTEGINEIVEEYKEEKRQRDEFIAGDNGRSEAIMRKLKKNNESVCSNIINRLKQDTHNCEERIKGEDKKSRPVYETKEYPSDGGETIILSDDEYTVS